MSNDSGNFRSIHAAEHGVGERLRRERRRRSRKLPRWMVLTGVLAVLGLGAGLFWRGWVGDGEVVAAKYEGLVVVVDGWSVATADSARLGFQWQGGSGGEVALRPVSAEQLEDVLSYAPQGVEAALMRQVSDSVDVSCDVGGCLVDGEPVGADVLTLSDDSEVSERLRGNGVSAGLFFASVPVSGGAGQVSVGFDGYEPVDFSGVEKGDWVVAAAGLGQMFVPEFAWAETDGQEFAFAATGVGRMPKDATGLVTGSGLDVAAVRGLGAQLPAANGWTASQLTYATSPSVGCRAGVLCFPGVVEADVISEAVESFEVSSQDEPGVVTLSDVVVEVELPGVVVQGEDEEFSGEAELRFVTVSLYQGADLVEVDRAGTVSGSDETDYSIDEVLEMVSLSGKAWELVS